MSPPLTDHALKLLSIVQGAGDWIGRAAIANMLGKNRLTPYDHQLLARLAEAGKIEMRTRPHSSPIGIQYEYRAVQNS